MPNLQTTKISKIRNQKKPSREITFEDQRHFPYWKEDKIFVFIVVFSIIFLIASWIFIAIFYAKLPPEIPFYYIKIGSEALAPKKDLFFLPLGFAFFSLLNYYLGHYFFYKDKIITQIYLYLPLFLNFLMLIILFRLFYLLGVIF